MSETEAQSGGAEGVLESQDVFEQLVTGEASLWKGVSDQGKQQVKAAMRSIAEIALERTNLISSDVVESISSMIAEIDATLSAQVNEIIHHPKFQQLESAWQGLHYLVNNSETGTELQIRVLNASKQEVGKVLRRFKGTNWDQSPLFKKLYETEYGTLGGHPYGCIVADYYFDHTPPDVEFLQGIARVSAAAHAPFISGASPSVLLLDSWQDLQKPKDISNLFRADEYAAWNALRESEDARYLGLAMPRFLGRQPYGARTNPIEEFAFEEDTGQGDSSKYAWLNAAYAMAANINRSYSNYGWCTRIRGVESGGTVENLPVHVFPTDDGGMDTKCPTEISITERRENELSTAGLMALTHRKGTNQATFLSAQSVQKPKTYEGPGGEDATKSAALSARLPYLFPVCRFAHYLKSIVRDRIGGFTSREQMERFLNSWIKNYVHGDPTNAQQEELARLPLAGAQVKVEDDPLNPGYYRSEFWLRPHYQLEGLTVALRLVSSLPQDRQQ